MQREVDVNGIKVHYSISGLSAGKTLVFIHGFWQSHGFWRKLIQMLERDHTCIALDLPGFGRSAMPDERWNIAEYADFLADFIDKLDIKNPIIIGHSFGAKIALTYASIYYNLSGLVIYSAGNIANKVNVIRSIVLIVLKGLAIFSPSLPYHVLSEIYLVRRNRQKMLMETERLKLMNSIFFANQRIPCINYANISAKTLLLYGENDQIAPAINGELLKKKINNSQLTILRGATHFAHVEKEIEFYQKMGQYLSSL